MYKLGPGPDSDATQPGSDSEKINSRMIISRIESFIFFSASSDMMTLYHDSSKFVPARKFQKT